eukprot:TRINITY_DN70189_c0_g1_i1.p2 TRINITY_DN70189_c0_g1~~TRINITY_DN70189_c0_g1_i1.p2  ORF type:complete len:100 (+),score=32.62 TRINITY_DN70189_c0_g1_i1:114-413(+)
MHPYGPTRFLSTTPAAGFHALASKARYGLFAICALAVFNKQKYYRSSLADEEEGTHDRVARTAHVVLPDGRLAQVYPVVHTRTFGNFWGTITEALNPLP